MNARRWTLVAAVGACAVALMVSSSLLNVEAQVDPSRMPMGPGASAPGVATGQMPCCPMMNQRGGGVGCAMCLHNQSRMPMGSGASVPGAAMGQMPCCPMMGQKGGGMGCAMCMHNQGARVPLIGETAPAFAAETTQGPINFPDDYKGKWVILFSHPADFTPVCTTEFMTFATMMPQFEALNCKLIGLSIDSNYSHIAWLRTIKEKIKYRGMENVEVTFPLIADVKMDVAKKFGMLQPAASDTKAVRAVFFIDPNSKIRALIYYPLSNGRNFQEIMRLLVAMQTSDANNVATPADWQPGDDVIVPPPGSCGTAKERVEQPAEGVNVLDWFMTFRKMPKSALTLPPGQK